ncbi:hypothetical protein [Streptomyces sp. NPDC088246]|uniref:hypothetical protein n=1 Tax=Streptomyces sp. NPDC088246 TaxID=3365842 RepID=UPI0038049551
MTATEHGIALCPAVAAGVPAELDAGGRPGLGHQPLDAPPHGARRHFHLRGHRVVGETGDQNTQYAGVQDIDPVVRGP